MVWFCMCKILTETIQATYKHIWTENKLSQTTVYSNQDSTGAHSSLHRRLLEKFQQEYCSTCMDGLAISIQIVVDGMQFVKCWPGTAPNGTWFLINILYNEISIPDGQGQCNFPSHRLTAEWFKMSQTTRSTKRKWRYGKNCLTGLSYYFLHKLKFM